MIETWELSRVYGNRTALRSLTLRVEPGEVLGFLGPNGAGKSTTVKLLTGMIKPTHGRATVAGFDVVEQPLEVKRRVGYVPESAALYESLTALQKIRDERAGPRITFLLRDPDARVQVAAVEAVGLLRTREATPDLLEALKRQLRNQRALNVPAMPARSSVARERRLYIRRLMERTALTSTALSSRRIWLGTTKRSSSLTARKSQLSHCHH